MTAPDFTSFTGKVAVVTGGASGIGKAVVERLASEGATIVVADLNEADGPKVAADAGGRFVKLDVADPDAWDAFIADVVATEGSLGIIHLNAGVTTQNGDLLSLTEQQYRRVMGANVDGVVYGARAAAQAMSKSGGGAIVCTASIAGLIGFSPDPIYTLTKHAVVGLVRALAQPLTAHGITINAVNPGIVETPLVGEQAIEMLKSAKVDLIPPSQIADGVVSAIRSGRSGECWACTAQAGNSPHEFAPVAGLPSGGLLSR
jgi:NAD(P)-dependent dehydrogenase (short-subunit alcohol dehydrogenase family)